MSDPMSERDVIAGVLKPLIRNEMRWPNDRDANLRALSYADALIAAGYGIVKPCTRRDDCTHHDKHDGRCFIREPEWCLKPVIAEQYGLPPGQWRCSKPPGHAGICL